ncbi:hypothetical protein BRADI_1g61371v3 [Brachypodium distachyon]|uniref:F-box domain-containing protein n=1 Tax=Brachypodium distachyon TaxID=15368 RepID=A0A2K2DST3_BRADI|nr:hypothetical protein BRADI_1g61371v3 [Brachypodium distachyon]
MHALGDLHTDVLVAILVRLPARSIARCRGVCRAWRSAISDPSFDIANAQRPATIAKKFSIGTSVVFDLFRGRWHRDNVHTSPPSNRALCLGSRYCSVRGSWDGVVCVEVRMTVPCGLVRCHVEQYVLWNPLTMACATVSAPAPAGNCGEIIGAYAHPETRRFHLLHASDETWNPHGHGTYFPGTHLMAPTTFRILRVGGDPIWRKIPHF